MNEFGDMKIISDMCDTWNFFFFFWILWSIFEPLNWKFGKYTKTIMGENETTETDMKGRSDAGGSHRKFKNFETGNFPNVLVFSDLLDWWFFEITRTYYITGNRQCSFGKCRFWNRHNFQKKKTDFFHFQKFQCLLKLSQKI